MVEAKDVTVNVLTSAVTTLVIIFLLIPLLKIPVPAVREIETIETKKYYYPYVTPVVLEGDYSTWTIYDTVLDNNLVFYQYSNVFGVMNQAKTRIVFIDANSAIMFIYDIASKTSGAAIGVQGSGLAVTEYYVGSVQGKYVVQVSSDTKSLLIFKDGALIQTIDVTANGAVSIAGMIAFITWDGQYAIIYAKQSVTGKGIFLIFKGS